MMLTQIAGSRTGARSLMRALDRMMVQLVNSDPVVDRLMAEQVGSRLWVPACLSLVMHVSVPFFLSDCARPPRTTNESQPPQTDKNSACWR
jgi:hypothetical protein